MLFLIRGVQDFITRNLYDGSLDSGQGLVEYAMLLILVAVIMVALILILGPGLSNIYANILTTI